MEWQVVAPKAEGLLAGHVQWLINGTVNGRTVGANETPTAYRKLLVGR